jgi:hypothetical protein
MAQRDNRHTEWVLGTYHLAGGATRRCPVQPSTPLGPDQVNVLLLLPGGLFPFQETNTNPVHGNSRRGMNGLSSKRQPVSTHTIESRTGDEWADWEKPC